MKTIRTIIVAINDLTGKGYTGLAGDLSSSEARSKALEFAVDQFPKMNYWYRAIEPLYKGSRLAIVHCTESTMRP